MAINDKYEDDFQKLIETGKEKGYLTFGEVNDLIPGEVNSADDLDDLMTTIGTQGIDLLEDQPKLAAEHDELDSEDSEDVELDLTPARWRRPTTLSACTCAKWERYRYSPAKAKWKSPSELSAARCA